jgi:hypothetical protein
MGGAVQSMGRFRGAAWWAGRRSVTVSVSLVHRSDAVPDPTFLYPPLHGGVRRPP